MTDKSADAGCQEAEFAAPATTAGDDIIYLPDDRQRTKKVTSGSENRQRQHVERFRTDDIEHEALHEQLRSLRLTLGEYVMQLGAIAGGNVSRPRRRGRVSVDSVALTQAVAAFNRVGNNHNQTARALNELLLIAQEQTNTRLESMVAELADAIRGLPDLFAEPVAAIKAVLSYDREG